MTKLQHWYQHQEMNDLDNWDILRGIVNKTIKIPKWLGYYVDEYNQGCLIDNDDKETEEELVLGNITFLN